MFAFQSLWLLQVALTLPSHSFISGSEAPACVRVALSWPRALGCNNLSQNVDDGFIITGVTLVLVNSFQSWTRFLHSTSLPAVEVSADHTQQCLNKYTT